jgi:hypothetical protein
MACQEAMETCLEEAKASLEEIEAWLMSSKNDWTKWTPRGKDDVVSGTLKRWTFKKHQE